MDIAPLPENESGRLRMLHLYRVLDTSSESCLDELTELASRICGTPIGLISLVDAHRQWFKSKIGIDATETSRDIAFCAHAILQDHPLVVPDARVDARFADNPLVTGAPGIRFYAGTPLTVAGGFRLGTLCVIDPKPRQLEAWQIQALETLGKAVVTQLELRRTLEDLEGVAHHLSICAWCRAVRGEDGRWKPLHDYVTESISVSHGICPNCSENFMHPDAPPAARLRS